MYLFKKLKASPLKPMVRIEHNLAEMVTRLPTKTAKQHLNKKNNNMAVRWRGWLSLYTSIGNGKHRMDLVKINGHKDLGQFPIQSAQILTA